MGQLNKMWREYKLEWAVLISMVSAVMVLLGVVGLYKNEAPDVLSSLVEPLGWWYLWLVLLGPMLMIFGVYYIYDITRKKKELAELLETNSKAVFVKNMDRVDELAWHLGVKFQVKVAQKKEEFSIRK